jgi:hypothetical protein
MSFMMKIDAARLSPLDQLVVDYFYMQKLEHHPTIDFCRQVFGVPDEDNAVAQRLSVAISTVRGWREVGRRATTATPRAPWSCQ